MQKTYFRYVLLVPALLILAATTIYPIAFAFVLSFREWKIAKSPTPGPFIGFENYQRAFSDANFWNALKVTSMYTVMGVGLAVGLGLAIALLLQKPTRASRIVKPLLIFPFAVSLALKGYSFRFMLVPEFGVLDRILDTLFPFVAELNWLAHPFWALFWMSVPEVWGWAPLIALMFLGALGSISPEIFEAAKVDGATNFELFWHITLPLLRPIIVIVTLLKSIFSLRMFDLVRTMTAGGPGRATETLNYYIYTVGFNFFDMGYASSLAVILAVLLSLFALLYSRVLLGGEK